MILTRRTFLQTTLPGAAILGYGRSGPIRATPERVVGKVFRDEEVDLTSKLFINCLFIRARFRGEKFTMCRCKFRACYTLHVGGGSAVLFCHFSNSRDDTTQAT